MRRAPHILALCLVFCVALGSTGCETTRAVATKREPLVVPPAPPRIITPVPEPEPAPVDLGEPEPVPQLPRQSKIVPRDNPPRVEPKPPQQGATATPDDGKTAAPVAPVSPAPELRTIDTPDAGKATRQVRDTIDNAGRLLAQIDYGRLAKASQLQYDMAKRFIEQSDEALKAKNYTAAQLMAEKAETIARELSGR